MSKIIYELKMFSSNLIKEPEFIIDGMKNILKIEGYDDEGRINKVKVELDSVLCYKKILLDLRLNYVIHMIKLWSF